MHGLPRDLRWCDEGKGLMEGHGKGDEEGCGERDACGSGCLKEGWACVSIAWG